MLALEYYLSRTLLNANAPEIRALIGEEVDFVDYTLSFIRRNHGDYTLLLEAILVFIEASRSDERRILEAARELETLAEAKVLQIPDAFPAEYASALAKFRQTHPNSSLRILMDRVSSAPINQYSSLHLS